MRKTFKALKGLKAVWYGFLVSSKVFMNYLALEDVGAFPTELLTPEFSAALVRENFVDLVIKERLSRAQEDEKLKHFFHMAQGARGEKIDDFFETLRLREEETLNGVVVAGSCQFSSVADQLFGQPCTKTWRGDVYLRRLALHIIAANEDNFRSFMLNANPKTRRQNRAAGESVCLTGYLQKMSNASTDGDALTLQALCDGLQCLIHIVKWDFSPLSDKTIALLDRKNIVISELRPRPTVVQNKDWEKLQVPKRELWLSLHGEAHFRSLQSMGHTEAEAMNAKALLLMKPSKVIHLPPVIHEIRSNPEPPPSVPEPPSEPQEELLECPICFEDPYGDATPDMCASKPNACSMAHVFHFQCLKTWSETANYCPYCKTNFQSIIRLGTGEAYPVVKGRAKKNNYNLLTTAADYEESDFDSGTEDDYNSSEEDEDQKCYECRLGNHARVLLLCDGPNCQNGAHTFCVGLTAIPEGEWFCRDCANGTNEIRRPTARPRRQVQRRRSGPARPTQRRNGQTQRRASAPARAPPEPSVSTTEVAMEILNKHPEEINSVTPWSSIIRSAALAEQNVSVGRNLPSVSLDRQAVAAPLDRGLPARQTVRIGSSPDALIAFAALDQLKQQKKGPRKSNDGSRSKSKYEISSSDSEDKKAPRGSSEVPTQVIKYKRPTAVAKRPRVEMGAASSSNAPNGHGPRQAPPAKAPMLRHPLLARLDKAITDHLAYYAKGEVSLEINRMSPEIDSLFHADEKVQLELLDQGLFVVLRKYFDPVHGKDILPYHIKDKLLRLLQVLPVQATHLRSSKLNTVLLKTVKVDETSEHAQNTRNLVEAWTHLVQTSKTSVPTDTNGKLPIYRDTRKMLSSPPMPSAKPFLPRPIPPASQNGGIRLPHVPNPHYRPVSSTLVAQVSVKHSVDRASNGASRPRAIAPLNGLGSKDTFHQRLL